MVGRYMVQTTLLFACSFVRLVMKSGGGADNLRHDKAQKGDDNKYEEEEEDLD